MEKTLWQEYQKNNIAPKFEGYLAKQKAYWDAFVKYKQSEDATEKSTRNKANAAKKKYHHRHRAAKCPMMLRFGCSPVSRVANITSFGWLGFSFC